MKNQYDELFSSLFKDVLKKTSNRLFKRLFSENIVYSWINSKNKVSANKILAALKIHLEQKMNKGANDGRLLAEYSQGIEQLETIPLRNKEPPATSDEI